MYIRPDSLKQNVGLQKSCKTERYTTKKINICTCKEPQQVKLTKFKTKTANT